MLSCRCHEIVVVVVVGVVGAGGGSVAVLAGNIGTRDAKSEVVVLSDHDSSGIPSSVEPSDHSSSVPYDEDMPPTPPSSAVPSDHDSDDVCPPAFAMRPGISSPLDYALKELGPLLQDKDLKNCGCQRGCWQAIAEDEEAVSLWRSFSDDFGQLKQPDEKQEADAFLLDMLKHCGPNGGALHRRRRAALRTGSSTLGRCRCARGP